MNVESFRSSLREWLDTHDLSPGPDHSLDGQVAQLARVRRALYDAGWMRYGWPSEVDGLGGPAVLRAVLGEEVATRELAEPGIYSMVEVLVPSVISYGSAELAAALVPRLLSGQEQWCQGFSEPGSGSDLASLTTRAVPRGDDWVVTGQKVWTSLAQYAAAAYCSPAPHLATAGSPRSSPTCPAPGSRSVHCGQCTASTSSPRCSSTTW